MNQGVTAGEMGRPGREYVSYLQEVSASFLVLQEMAL